MDKRQHLRNPHSLCRATADDIQHLLQPHLKVKSKNVHSCFIFSLRKLCQHYPMAHCGTQLVPSPIDWGTWPLFAAVLVQWRQSWCSGRLLQWQHQQSELPSPSLGPPGLRVQINAGCLHPAPPGDCQTGTSSECCHSLSPQVCKYTHIHTHTKTVFVKSILICWMHRICFLVKLDEYPWAKSDLLTFVIKSRYCAKRRKKATSLQNTQWSSQCPSCLA